MKRKFAGCSCVYCGDHLATTDDHIFARAFFHDSDRDNVELPEVPACEQCNTHKSQLELYAVSVLGFGGRHGSAVKNAYEVAVKRIEKNKKLHRQLQAGFREVWIQENGGVIQRTAALPVDTSRLGELFAYVGRALLWHHGKHYLPPDYRVHVRWLRRGRGSRIEEGDRPVAGHESSPKSAERNHPVRGRHFR